MNIHGLYIYLTTSGILSPDVLSLEPTAVLPLTPDCRMVVLGLGALVLASLEGMEPECHTHYCEVMIILIMI